MDLVLENHATLGHEGELASREHQNFLAKLMPTALGLCRLNREQVTWFLRAH